MESGAPVIHTLSALSSSVEMSNKTTLLTLLDSGATDHCFASPTDFASYRPFDTPRSGHPANKSSVFNITGMGTVEMYTQRDGTLAKIFISDALHAPELRHNLISVSKLTSKGLNITFDGETAIVRDTKGTIVIIAHKREGLYVVETIQRGAEISAHLMQTKRKPVPFDTWHRRLAHAGEASIKEMLRLNLVDGLDVDGRCELGGMCEDCIYGKHTAHPHSEKGKVETEVLERIHVDIWGPAPVQSVGGSRYLMVVVDGASSFRTVFPLSDKSADTTLARLRDFQTQSELQTGKKLKRIRLDMGREWHNNLWETYAREKGIILEFTTPYAHQQNGVAERSMRTLVELGRSMLAESGLPQRYWADTFVTAGYIKNLLPTSRIPGKIPAEVWTGKHQDISHLRAYGSTAYAHVPLDLGTSKLAPRSVKLTLIGYFGISGYKLLDRSSGGIFRSQDVIFDEGRTNFTGQAPNAPVVKPPQSFRRPQTTPVATANAPQPHLISTLHNDQKSPSPLTPDPFRDDSDVEERLIEAELTGDDPVDCPDTNDVVEAPLRRSG